MKRFKYFLVAALFSLSLSSFFIAAPRAAAAEQAGLICYYNNNDGDYYASTSDSCDLAIDKQVSVNGGDFVEAETAGQALNVNVGDTVTWKITVSSNSPDSYYPGGQVTVDDVLPSGVSLTNSSASTGEYNSDTGQWTINLADLSNLCDNQDYQEPLPATLTLTTTVTQTGLMENTADLNDYTPPCDRWCEDPSYVDFDNTNNSHSAWINVAVQQTVTTSPSTPAAPNTGFGMASTDPWTVVGLGVGTSAVLGGLAYGIRKNAIRIPKIKS